MGTEKKPKRHGLEKTKRHGLVAVSVTDASVADIDQNGNGPYSPSVGVEAMCLFWKSRIREAQTRFLYCA